MSPAQYAVWITLATVVIGFATAVIEMRRNGKRLEGIHVLVNSRLTSVVNRVAQLIIVLKDHGIEVPEDPDGPES
jgi:ABC-type spermidine/putrescine transport system permease subunit I